MQVSNPFRTARFVLGAHRLDQLPPDAGAEVAFAGRSNAGKSSALNAICDQRNLARTSRTPGRTQQINVFELGSEQRLVDLPGYGYARVPEALRLHWRGVLDAYLRSRGSLMGLVLVMDVRHPLREFDRDLLAFAAASRRRCHCLLTKADKLSRSQAQRALAVVTEALAGEYPGFDAQLFSATAGSGVDAARELLAAWLGV